MACKTAFNFQFGTPHLSFVYTLVTPASQSNSKRCKQVLMSSFVALNVAHKLQTGKRKKIGWIHKHRALLSKQAPNNILLEGFNLGIFIRELYYHLP